MSAINNRTPISRVRLEESLELIAIRKNILRGALIVASLMGTILYFTDIAQLVQQRAWLVIGLRSLAYGALLACTAFDQISYNARAHTFLTLIYLMGVASLIQRGLEGEGRLFLLAFAVLGMILYPFRVGMWIFSLGVLTLGAVGGVMLAGLLPLPVTPAVMASSTISGWLAGGLGFLTVSLLIITSLFALVRGIEQTMIQQKQAAIELDIERRGLEQRIQERTDILQQQARLLEISSTFAREVSQRSEVDEIIDFTMAFFKTRFGFENSALYLLDTTQEFFVLKSAAGPGTGLFREYLGRIRYGQPGTLSELFTKAQPRWLQNSGDEAIYFKQAALQSLANTLILPVSNLGKPIGGMLFFGQSETSARLQDLQLYQNIITQLGTALEKARLFTETRRSLEELKTSGRQETRKTWREAIRSSRRPLAYRIQHGVLENSAELGPGAAQAIYEGKAVIVQEPGRGKTSSGTTVAVPIMLRDQSFGAVEISFAGGAVPQDMIAMVESTVKRLAVALENARLVEQIQKRAEREHTVGQITAKIREVSDIDSILKVAAAEIGQSLNVSEVSVQLRTTETGPLPGERR